jgi:hypothetical protein
VKVNATPILQLCQNYSKERGCAGSIDQRSSSRIALWRSQRNLQSASSHCLEEKTGGDTTTFERWQIHSARETPRALHFYIRIYLYKNVHDILHRLPAIQHHYTFFDKIPTILGVVH